MSAVIEPSEAESCHPECTREFCQAHPTELCSARSVRSAFTYSCRSPKYHLVFAVSQVGVPGEGAVPGLVPAHLLLQLSAAQPATMRLYLPAQVRKMCAHSPGGSSQSRLPQQFTGTWWKESGEVYEHFLLNLAWFSLAPCVLFLSGREFPTDTFCVWFRRVRSNEARARFEKTALK